ncbi:MAG: polyprenyl diphosphate synthase [Planctomycetaceae bacterium]
MSNARPYAADELAAFGLDSGRLPRHVAFIMDGNGRWAVSRQKPRIEGHREGAKTARMVIEESARLGLEQVTLFCLSSENWKRPADELQLLLQLLEEYLVREREEVVKRNLRFAMIGRRDELPEGVLRELDATAAAAAANTGTRLCLAINYGSRAEIVEAARRLAVDVAAGRLSDAEIDENAVASRLDTAGMPDPDLVIRTAGEMRLSNFLLWQFSYAELHVSPKCWPDFSRDDYFAALRDYAVRDRRYGGLKA